jgi:hypothetical protein
MLTAKVHLPKPKRGLTMPIKKYSQLSDLPEESDTDVENTDENPKKKFNYAPASQSKVKAGYSKTERLP